MSKAFTLIELIIVISIIGSTSIISIGSILRLKDSFALNAAAGQLRSELNILKQKAVLSSAKYELYCTENYYLLKKQNDLLGDFMEIKKTYFDGGISFLKQISIRFASSGFPYPGYFGTLVLKNKHGKTKKIVVSSVGRIRIE